ncbi:MAG: histidine kinase [Sphingobacteriaceae bacterium]|nr:histidine kinase [Sphingobacteriaceae bacterium]
MSLALLGVIGMQFYFLRESYRLKTQLFNQAVKEALNTLVAKIEKQDAFNFLDSKEKEQEYQRTVKPSSQLVKVKVPLPREAESKKQVRVVDEATTLLPSITSGHSRFVFRQSGEANQDSETFISRLKNGTADTLRLNIAQLATATHPVRLNGTYNVYRKKPEYTREANTERYAKLLEAEQFKADRLFEKRDSIFRQTHPVAFAYKNVIPDVNENLPVDLKLDVVEYADELGRMQQFAKLNVVPKNGTFSETPTEPRREARKDTIIQYVVMDPQVGPRIYTRVKPRMVQIDPQILEEDHAKQLKEASRVNKFVKKIETKNALQALVTEFQRVDLPLSERIKFSLLDSLLKAELKSNGIDIPFEYKITSSKKDSVIFTKASDKQAFVPQNTYQAILFPKDIVRDAGLLTLTFPGKNSVIFSNMSVMMGSSAGLLMVLLFCFGYTIHIILRQKKISEMKTDFINNMTHEFKTPVATIMIASEALKDPEITEDQSRISRLAGIIYDENVRLGSHIERVLNIAKIDKDDLKLEHKPVDMNDLIAAIIDTMALQIQKKEATVDLDLKAEMPVVYGDELHLSNVIFNLLDNAIKYSKENPHVSIATFNQGKNLVIRVTDQGIGMNKDQLSRIFEQFYRIPTGNLHDVKGFGLGLSYVNNIVKRLNGTVKVKSEKDKGSEFEIILPAQYS